MVRDNSVAAATVGICVGIGIGVFVGVGVSIGAGTAAEVGVPIGAGLPVGLAALLSDAMASLSDGMIGVGVRVGASLAAGDGLEVVVGGGAQETAPQTSPLTVKMGSKHTSARSKIGSALPGFIRPPRYISLSGW